MPDIQPTEEQKKNMASQAQSSEPEAEPAVPATKESEAKKAMDEARLEEEKQAHLNELVRSKKYYLPIKK